jgi:hypothetical protein
VLAEQQRAPPAAGQDVVAQALLQEGGGRERDAPQPPPAELWRRGRGYPSASSAKKSASTKSTLIVALTTPTP